ncbi:MAG TPA: dienelactone hydrolase family protein [Terracidiphilus sp.]|jgi:carboxymethylenebutenolidase|nr:dienelactone hydrolase family protein [Terracidiphilus sp.]
MGETVVTKATDGHELDLYVARPKGEPIAGLVVIQEIFGVNRHIRSVADGYAKDGFLVAAPALFDRVEKGVDLTYEGADAQKGMNLMQKIDLDEALIDVNAALTYVREPTGKKAGVIGYCLGGLLAWLSAARLHPDVAVGYYAGSIGKYAAETPRVPVQLHFGKLDTHIPAEQVEKVHAAHPEVEIHWYEGAGHGFNCDMRASYNQEASALARKRALAFLKENLT